MTEPVPAAAAAAPGGCPACGAAAPAGAAFCEVCGTPIPASADAAPVAFGAEPGAEDLERPIELTRSVRHATAETAPAAGAVRPCTACGGTVGADGYCEVCGTKALSERDHYTEEPTPWVAAVCDKGIRHYRNEDASAVAADAAPGSRAGLVVCDGVSSSLDSDVASLAGARRARDVLVANRPAGLGTPASRVAASAAALAEAAKQANQAVIANTAAASDNAASCTFVAVVVDNGLLVCGNVGDSRAYWIPDPGTAEQPVGLSVDDSVAQARIAMGVPRDEAENGPQAHAITKWLGRDSPDATPSVVSRTVGVPGWVVVCSDGLWNYVSEPADLQALIAELSTTAGTPLELADKLVVWANAQGGKDNITVALARLGEVASGNTKGSADG